jgi:TPR repeat protein
MPFREQAHALSWLKKLARKGNRYAQYELAMKTEDLGREMELLRMSAEQGNRTAQYWLGAEFSGRDYGLAAHWLRKAATNPELACPPHPADDGISMPQSELAHLYREGKGVERDPAQAAYWYEKSANGYNCGAYLALAMAYECGYGVERDIEKAGTLYRKKQPYSSMHEGHAELAEFFLELMDDDTGAV